MKRVRTKSSDVAGNMEPPKKAKETSNGKRSASPKSKRTPSPPNNKVNGVKHEAAKFKLRLISHGRVNGSVDDPDDGEEMLRFTVRDVPNPPAKLRKKYTGLSPRLRTEIFSEKIARLKYDTIVIEMEKMMTTMETAMNYDAAHQDDVDDPSSTTLIISIQCEEGKHRSVSYVEELAQSDTTKRKDWAVSVEHRDLGIGEMNGDNEDDDSDELPSPTSGWPKESIKTMKKKKDKNMKKARDRRLQVEVADSGAEDGFM